MASDAAPKKCRRFSHFGCCSPPNRSHASCTRAVPCSVCPGCSFAIFDEARRRSSSHTNGSNSSAALGSPRSMDCRMRVMLDILVRGAFKGETPCLSLPSSVPRRCVILAGTIREVAGSAGSIGKSKRAAAGNEIHCPREERDQHPVSQAHESRRSRSKVSYISLFPYLRKRSS